MAETITIEPDFAAWRERARALLAERIAPGEVFWNDTGSDQGELFADASGESADGGDVATGEVATGEVATGKVATGEGSARVRDASPDSESASKPEALRVPKAFVALAEVAACHSDPERWGLLYRMLWRIVHGGERHLLVVATDSDVRRVTDWAREVGRDIHKMRAFVRFRKVGERPEGREQFAAWFEPMHHIVRRNAPFFRKRFAGMDWSILTPRECVHWDGGELVFTPGLSRSEAPDGDALEELWRGYYRSIFNPARLKPKAMQAEMPKKYWKNLPEAPLIEELTRDASRRRDEMIDRPALEPRKAPENLYLQSLERRNETPVLQEAPSASGEDAPDLSRLRELAACCRACPLWENATRTVFGEGPGNADLMIVGEQPGDREDIEGRPFVGPAGRLLDEALERAGFPRSRAYVTNAVKHFKWRPAPRRPAPRRPAPRRKPTRLHEKADRSEMGACRPWLLGEIANVKPRVILTLGNSAGQSVVGPDFRIMRDRGEVASFDGLAFSGRIFATVHPSFLLRLPEPEQRETERQRFFEEVARAVQAAARGESGDAESGDAESGDAESGDAESGDAESGDAESGDAESGDAESGDAESGDA